MATSDVAICNLALQRIGAEAITSLADNTDRARACNRSYAETRDRLLDEIKPNFAVSRVALAQLVATPVYGYGYFYQLPVNALRVLDINGEEEDGWKREGNRVACDAATVEARLIVRVEDVTTFTPLFTEALIAQLAAEIAFPIAKSNALTQQKKQEAELAIAKAQAAEGAEGSMVAYQDSTLYDARQ